MQQKGQDTSCQFSVGKSHWRVFFRCNESTLHFMQQHLKDDCGTMNGQCCRALSLTKSLVQNSKVVSSESPGPLISEHQVKRHNILSQLSVWQLMVLTIWLQLNKAALDYLPWWLPARMILWPQKQRLVHAPSNELAPRLWWQGGEARRQNESWLQPIYFFYWVACRFEKSTK